MTNSSKYNWLFNFSHTPGVMKRGQHVLIAVEKDGKLVLGKKDIYPSHIARLIGGGMDESDPTKEAGRELHEEVGIKAAPDELTKIATIDATIIETTTQKRYLFTSHVFHLETDQPLSHADDLDGLESYNPAMLKNLINAYQELDDQLISIGTNGEQFRWSDYGAYYGRVHQVVLDWWTNQPQ